MVTDEKLSRRLGTTHTIGHSEGPHELSNGQLVASVGPLIRFTDYAKPQRRKILGERRQGANQDIQALYPSHYTYEKQLVRVDRLGRGRCGEDFIVEDVWKPFRSCAPPRSPN